MMTAVEIANANHAKLALEFDIDVFVARLEDRAVPQVCRT